MNTPLLESTGASWRVGDAAARAPASGRSSSIMSIMEYYILIVSRKYLDVGVRQLVWVRTQLPLRLACLSISPLRLALPIPRSLSCPLAAAKPCVRCRCFLPPPKPTMPSPPSVHAVPLWPLPKQCCQDESLPLPMAARRRCQGASGHLQPSQGAPTSAAGASGARTPLAPTLTAGIDRPRSLSPTPCCKSMF
jgi:hypothetical protein